MILDVSKCKVTKGEDVIELSTKETLLLEILMRIY